MRIENTSDTTTRRQEEKEEKDTVVGSRTAQAARGNHCAYGFGGLGCSYTILASDGDRGRGTLDTLNMKYIQPDVDEPRPHNTMTLVKTKNEPTADETEA